MKKRKYKHIMVQGDTHAIPTDDVFDHETINGISGCRCEPFEFDAKTISDVKRNHKIPVRGKLIVHRYVGSY